MGGFLIFWEVGAVTVDFVSDLNLVLKKKKSDFFLEFIAFSSSYPFLFRLVDKPDMRNKQRGTGRDGSLSCQAHFCKAPT